MHELIRFYFSYEHLPEKHRELARDFYALALKIEARDPESSETTIALRKLLEARDAVVPDA